MTSFRSQLLAFLLSAFVLSLTAPSQQLMQSPFKIRGESTIVVPVLINGACPFDFMLDTGTTNTIIDRKLAEELHLPLVGKGTVATLQNEAAMPIVQVGSISWQVPTCTVWISSLSPTSRIVLLMCACEELSERILCDTSTF
jgi:predicted aspartyl protease